MKIEFFAKSNFDLIENVSFSISSNDITLIEISPSNYINLDENGITGYAIIRLDKVYINALINNEIASSSFLYFRYDKN